MFKNSSSGITPVCLKKRDVFGMVVGGGGVVGALLPFLAWNDVASFPQQQHNNNNQDKQHFYRRGWGVGGNNSTVSGIQGFTRGPNVSPALE
jgi:hypothetical protein